MQSMIVETGHEWCRKCRFGEKMGWGNLDTMIEGDCEYLATFSMSSAIPDIARRIGKTGNIVLLQHIRLI
jgi:hypothetical protein